MKKTILSGALALGVAVSFTGCSLGNPPQPYTKNVDSKFLHPNKKQEVLNDVIKTLTKSSGFTASNGCIEHFFNERLARHFMKNCFVVSKDKIIREDKSTYKWNSKPFNVGPENYIDRGTREYTAFINNLQSSGQIETLYNEKLKEQ